MGMIEVGPVYPARIITLILIAAALPSGAALGEPRLADAMRAMEADSSAAALELSAGHIANPWLEVYRLRLRAEAFLSQGDSLSAAGRAAAALRIISRGDAAGHPEEAALIDMLVSASGAEIALPYIEHTDTGRLTARTLLRTASYLLAAGDSSAAARFIASAAWNRPGKEDIPLIEDLASAGALSMEEVTTDAVSKLASAAIAADLPATARTLIDIAASDSVSLWIPEILRGDLLASTGREARAMRRYRSVFESDIWPVAAKKRALLRLAALQYRMRQYRGSAESYRTFGSCYPDDPMAETATDRAARIDVASGRWHSAIETWRRIALAGPSTFTGQEAVLAMAVALDRIGRRHEAYEVLASGLDRVRGNLRPAYLYWMVRTCGDEAKRSGHEVILVGEGAYSFYAVAIEEGAGFLDAREERSIVPSAEALEGRTRKAGFPGIEPPPPRDSLDAFRYLAENGRSEEAGRCVRAYLEELDDASRKLSAGAVYGEAREAGMENICLELTVDHPDLFTGRKDYVEFLYPFAFGSLIDSCSASRSLPPELVLAVIREESRFDSGIRSPAGAWGLMQVMPATGEWIGGKLGYDSVSESDLRDPRFNIAAGCWYLRFLLDRGDESIVAALAAFNAGHGRMSSWKKRFKPSEDPLAAIELIGPEETRHYVRRVLDTMAAYERLTSALAD